MRRIRDAVRENRFNGIYDELTTPEGLNRKSVFDKRKEREKEGKSNQLFSTLSLEGKTTYEKKKKECLSSKALQSRN